MLRYSLDKEYKTLSAVLMRQDAAQWWLREAGDSGNTSCTATENATDVTLESWAAGLTLLQEVTRYLEHVARLNLEADELLNLLQDMAETAHVSLRASMDLPRLPFPARQVEQDIIGRLHWQLGQLQQALTSIPYHKERRSFYALAMVLVRLALLPRAMCRQLASQSLPEHAYLPEEIQQVLAAQHGDVRHSLSRLFERWRLKRTTHHAAPAAQHVMVA